MSNFQRNPYQGNNPNYSSNPFEDPKYSGQPARPSDTAWAPPPVSTIVDLRYQSSTVSTSVQSRSAGHLRKRSVPFIQAQFVEEPKSFTNEYQNNPFENHSPRHDRDEDWNNMSDFLYSEAPDVVARSLQPPTRKASGSSNSSHSQEKYDLFQVTPATMIIYSSRKDNDDLLHDPGPLLKRSGKERRIMEPSPPFKVSWIGFFNLATLVALAIGLVLLFALYPLYKAYTSKGTISFSSMKTFETGTIINSRAPSIPTHRGLIDSDTPTTVYNRTGFDGKRYGLVFSDEFNVDGRSFYPGMDPFWEAVDLHYWQTGNHEYYDPDNIQTADGHLEISFTQETLADSHGFGYLGGMLQSWNAFCFTGGYIEVSVTLPGSNRIPGFWPAVWTMGNLGRAGYGGSLEGNWPYSYTACDAGTLKNQSLPNGIPAAAAGLSYLPGQRFSACTCPSEKDHPGPKLTDGSWGGRSSPEIDVFEASINRRRVPHVSQSAQWAPFNLEYLALDGPENMEFFNTSFGTSLNSYKGGIFQQVTSGLSGTKTSGYELTGNQSVTYGFEYTPTYVDGFGTGRITWMQDNEPMWTLYDRALAGDERLQMSNREVTGEPLYIIMNLGMSDSFAEILWNELTFPAKMRVDYVRVYQDVNHINVGCSPPKYPSADYIKKNSELFLNPNITVIEDVGRVFPKNRLIDKC